ncbi:MAG: DUF2125 domain-containing protein [Limimaricola sp.]|uniref:DUF2125 domain-containing protein n=1 Tax=Limimaricola sp. TaxID=2211665 RepID=UPI001DDB3A34|nr:DUF2125 domain-containing protein [Limimaricola sp.]MBI1417017.1 DUF2125 domain-containing protein [Limimaricola sp.]
MRHSTLIRSGVCVAAIIAGGAAWADVTPQDVWNNWKSNMSMAGPDVVQSASESTSGNTLTVSGLSLNFKNKQNDGTAKIDVGDVVFTGNGDGTVTVTVPEKMPFNMDMTDSSGSQTISADVIAAGMKMVVSGTPDAMNYAVSANRYGFALTGVTQDGDAVPTDATVNLNNVSANYLAKTGDMDGFTYSMTADTLDMLVESKDQQAGPFTLSGQIGQVAATGNVTMPKGMDMSNPSAAYAQGFAFQGGYTFGSANYLFSSDASDGKTDGTISLQDASLDAALSKDGLTYDTTVNGLKVSVTTSSLPFPINISMSQLAYGLTFPLSKSDTPVPYAMNVNLADVAVNEEIWSMIDPTGMLPHDPATAKIDVSGTATLAYDLMDPAQAAAAAADAPGEVNSVDLNDLNVAIAGASLTGTGHVTLDNTDMTTMPGMPRPDGSITLQLNGANGLLDTLVKMGLVPDDQAQMGRMMMGMFAKVVGDDQLTSTIEFTKDGQILANGQRIK